MDDSITEHLSPSVIQILGIRDILVHLKPSDLLLSQEDINTAPKSVKKWLRAQQIARKLQGR